jgi:hypothetical protein
MMTDDELEALLRGATAESSLPDGGFTAGVMRRVRAEPDTLDAVAALAALRAREASARRASHWRWIGAAAGAGVAIVPIFAGGLPPALQAPQLLALVLAAGAAAWALAAPALREDR